MRIAFVTQWFAPEPGAVIPVFIPQGLAERGHHVDVLTGFPNYPTGRLHPDYPLQRYRRDEVSERLTVHRAPLYPSHDRNAVRRAANYLSFGAAASWVARTRLPRPDAWLTYSSPATAVLPALTVPRRLRAPSYLLIQDLWPDSVVDSGFVGGAGGRAIERAAAAFCGLTYRRADGIGVISPGMRQILLDRGAAPERVHLTPNWVSDGHLLPHVAPSDELRASLGLPRGRLFMYAGTMGELQGLGPLVEAFGRCPQANLVLVGGGVARADLQELARGRGMANVHFVDAQPVDRIGAYIAASDVQVVSLKDTPLLRATMPSKVQAAMAAGRAILAHAAGDAAELVTANRAGWSVAPGDPDSAVRAVRGLDALPLERLYEMGRNARACYLANFTPAAGVDRLERMLGVAMRGDHPAVAGRR